MTPHAETALAILARLPGARVIGCPPLTKGSRTSDWAQKAIAEPALVEKLFDDLATLSLDGSPNVGLVIGPRVAVIDIEGPDKKTEQSREGLREFAALQDQFGSLPPSLSIETPSGGKHLYYLVPEGVILKPFSKLLGSKGIELRTGDQLVMLPPSRVQKATGEMCEYRFVSGAGPAEINVATLPADWINAIRTSEKIKRGPVARQLLAAAPTDTPEKKPKLASIAAGCAFIRHVIDEAEAITEPEWYAALSVVGLCENGTQIAHEMSRPYPGYNFDETQRKIEHAITDAKPRTCQNIASEVGFEGCQRCPFRAMRNKSPIGLGYQPENVVEVQASSVFIVSTEQYADLKTGTRHRPTGFAAKVRDQIGRNPHDQLMGLKTTPKVDYADYLAGDERLIVDAHGTKVLNLWKRDGVSPAEGDHSTLTDFLRYLIPDEISREHLYDYLASLLQRRGSKIKHAMILTGPFGVGKSSLNLLIQRLFGENARRIEGEQLGSRWSSSLVNCEVLIAEEAALGERYETYERLKELVTGEHFIVEEKFVSPYKGRTPRGLFIISNHENPLAIAQGDRRFAVIAAADEKAAPEFYTAVYRALADESAVAGFAQALLQRDLAKFNPHAPPPMTAAKRSAITASRTPLAQVITEAIESERLWRDVVTLDQIRIGLTTGPWLVQNLTPHRLAAALKQVGALQRERIRLGTVLARPWIIRNLDKWRSADLSIIREEMQRNLPTGEPQNVIPIRQTTTVVQEAG